MELKTCTQCGETKELHAFRKQKGCKNGVCPHCIDCKRRMDKEWRVKNSEKKHEADRQWRMNNSERKKMIDKLWHAKNREKHIAQMKVWQRANPLLVRVLAWNKMGKSHTSTDYSVTHDAVLLKLENQVYKCIYCKDDIHDKFQIDHILPFARGGRHTIDNIQFLCTLCNMQKHTMTHEEFLIYPKRKMIQTTS